ncbi:5-oxoprolinase subunit PxpB [Psychrosphaera sp. 1_MG-2023]|uniref:5-oxoprolinase subunit PxpB n=1 Tax=Psychrosphaera sp. 1_MG-2023 TaxID=3062643 RepID=UPI0026E1868D|nr:5-oxoprolinase subunit PxpB [Psychrosphaera sp. 1_MG-2023]MDO6718749.1 5-oxoprolinase subunit PxpB [Psychrosphaera sp. 1_MG-2023]
MSDNLIRVEVASERALIVYFEQELSTKLAAIISLFCQQLGQHRGALTLEVIPSYTSVLVQYSPFETDHFAIQKLISNVFEQLETQLADTSNSSPTGLAQNKAANVVELPVYYGDEVALDLERIALHHNLSKEQVIDIHCEQLYRVFAIGFAPGFGYLGEVDSRIAMPRLETPRMTVPKGAVAIADRQTAIYPAVSPGGWNIIGRCPIAMFNPSTVPHMPFSVGDSVKFKAIDKVQFVELGGEL